MPRTPSALANSYSGKRLGKASAKTRRATFGAASDIFLDPGNIPGYDIGELAGQDIVRLLAAMNVAESKGLPERETQQYFWAAAGLVPGSKMARNMFGLMRRMQKAKKLQKIPTGGPGSAPKMGAMPPPPSSRAEELRMMADQSAAYPVNPWETMPAQGASSRAVGGSRPPQVEDSLRRYSTDPSQTINPRTGTGPGEIQYPLATVPQSQLATTPKSTPPPVSQAHATTEIPTSTNFTLPQQVVNRTWDPKQGKYVDVQVGMREGFERIPTQSRGKLLEFGPAAGKSTPPPPLHQATATHYSKTPGRENIHGPLPKGQARRDTGGTQLAQRSEDAGYEFIDRPSGSEFNFSYKPTAQQQGMLSALAEKARQRLAQGAGGVARGADAYKKASKMYPVRMGAAKQTAAALAVNEAFKGMYPNLHSSIVKDMPWTEWGSDLVDMAGKIPEDLGKAEKRQKRLKEEKKSNDALTDDLLSLEKQWAP